MNCPSKIPPIVWAGIAALLVASASFGASAQELEARAYSPAPLGVNFLGLSYLRSTGGVAVDPSLPLDNVDAEVNTASLAYARTFGLFGRSASIGFVLPYSRRRRERRRVRTAAGGHPYRPGRSTLAPGDQSVRWAGGRSGRVRRPRTLHHTGHEPHGRGAVRAI